MSTFTLIIMFYGAIATVGNFQTRENCVEEGNKWYAQATRQYMNRPSFICIEQKYVLDDVQGPN